MPSVRAFPSLTLRLNFGLWTLLTTFAVLSGGIRIASAQDAESQFRSGLEAFRKNDFKAAEKSFIEVLQQAPASRVALHNLALAEAKDGQLGLAIALWRKALALEPGYAPAEFALNWAKTKLDHPEIPHEVEYWETFRSAILTEASLPVFLGITALLLFGAGWLVLQNLGQKRRALLDEKPLPPFPVLALGVGILCVLFAFLSLAKAIDLNSLRGTVVEKKIEARSAPDSGSTSLFDLYEGLEVLVDQVHQGWVQVTYPGGPTGWIPETALFTTVDTVQNSVLEKKTEAPATQPSPNPSAAQPAAPGTAATPDEATAK